MLCRFDLFINVSVFECVSSAPLPYLAHQYEKLGSTISRSPHLLLMILAIKPFVLEM